MGKKNKKKRAPASGDVATNRRARQKFELVEKVEAGIVLLGTEVKALRQGEAQMGDAYATIEDGEVWLRNLPHSALRTGHHQQPRARASP